MIQTASLFSQLLKHFPRTEFADLVKKHAAERGAKGFTCWSQFVAMLFCHTARADSLREICNGLACCLGKLSHLGIGKAPKRSTLSYANEHRPAILYEDLFWTALKRFRSGGLIGPKRKSIFRFKNKLLSFDSSTISLCLSLFPWANYRRTKGGVKLHVLLDHDDYMPSFVHLTEARVHDRQIARHLKLPVESIIAIDRAYVDYRLFAEWTKQKVTFVTRMKVNMVYKVQNEQRVPKNRNILSDQIITLDSIEARKKDLPLLRRISVWDEAKKRVIVLLTNNLKFGSTTISSIYKERWEIEIFFKTLKQQLKVKTFIGTSENALRIQIWTAMIALMLLKWMHYISKAGWSLSNLATLLRMNLFTYRDLQEWIDNPLNTPPKIPTAQQLPLF